MLFGFEDARDDSIGSKKDLLIRDADNAFDANDKLSCVDAIDQLYELLDSTFVNLRCSSPPLRRAR